MSKVTKTIEKHYCDICRKECEPIKEVTLINRPTSAGFERLNLIVDCSVDYVSDTSYGDACISCLLSGVKSWVTHTESELKP